MTGRGEATYPPSGDTQPDVVPASECSQPQVGTNPALMRAKRPSKGRTALSEQTRNRLAVKLRAMYDDVVQQPVPDRFADLIARLDGGRDKM